MSIDDMDPATLNDRFGEPGRVRFEAGEGGLTRAVLTGAHAAAEVYLHGAHVASYEPVGGRDVLFMSRASRFAPGEPIRGGVPICFPWFGPRADDADAPAHGVARTQMWEVASAEATAGDDVRVELATRIAPYRLRYLVDVGPALTMSLAVHNEGGEEAAFEAALHTYLAVSEIGQVEITGLERTAYIDKAQEGARRQQGGEPIRFEAETDRVYQGTEATCTLRDAGWERAIVVAKDNSQSTVVWNPWHGKAARLADFGDDEWPGMACIETANVGEQAVTLAPGQTHTMTARVWAEAL